MMQKQQRFLNLVPRILTWSLDQDILKCIQLLLMKCCKEFNGSLTKQLGIVWDGGRPEFEPLKWNRLP